MPVINVILGRQTGTNLLQVSGANNNVIGVVGQIGSVDNGVSRQHLKFSIDAKTLEVTITNINPNNQTRVNGSEILSSKVDANDKIELGMNSYRLDINSIIALLQNEGLLPKEYSIKHLETVWKHYNETNKNNQIRQGRLNAILGLSSIFTLGSFLAAAFIPREDNGLSPIQIGGYCLAMIFAFVTAVVKYRGAPKTIKQKEELEDYMQQNYVCPNSACHHFLGNQKYSLVLQNGKCPYCGSKFVE